MSVVEEEVESLPELLTRYLRENGESGRSFARRAAALGHELSYSLVNEIRRGTVTRPGPAKLDAIAETAGFSRARVYASVGLPAPGHPFVDEVAEVEGVDLLSRAERDAIVQMLKVMVEQHRTPDPAEGAERIVPLSASTLLIMPKGRRQGGAADPDLGVQVWQDEPAEFGQGGPDGDPT